MIKGFSRLYVIFIVSLNFATRAHTELSVVYVTINSPSGASELANSIISNELAACVNILPGITSIYKWEGKVITDTEHLLMIKTRNDLLQALTAHIKAHHPYSLPEIIAVPIEFSNPAYLEWIKESTKS